MRLLLTVFRLSLLLLLRTGMGAKADEPPPLKEENGHHIFFTYAPPRQPFIVMQVSVNGKPALPFMVDTGFSVPVVLAPWAAQQMGLEPNQAKIRLNGAVDAKAVTISSLDIPGLTPDDSIHYNMMGSAANAYVVDLSFMDPAYVGPRVAGVIGAPVLAPTTARFDFAKRQLTLFPEPHAPLQITGAWNIPLTLRDDRYYAVVTCPDGASERVLVDTGGIGTSLPMSLSPHLKPMATRIAGTGQLDNITLSSEWLLPNLKIGPLVEPLLAATESTADGSELGLDFLTRYRITFDFRNKQLTLEKAINYDRIARLSGWTGATVNVIEGKVIVMRVRPNSPAEQAGLGAKDEILAVDDAEMTGLNSDVAQKLLDGSAGTPATLQIRSFGASRKLTITRKSSFDRPASLFDGVMLYRQLQKNIVILDIAPDCPAAKAGLKREDQILEIDNVDTKKVNGPDLLETLRDPIVTLRVKHKGEKASHILTLGTVEK